MNLAKGVQGAKIVFVGFKKCLRAEVVLRLRGFDGLSQKFLLDNLLEMVFRSQAGACACANKPASAAF
jgi:hypothetical protein